MTDPTPQESTAGCLFGQGTPNPFNSHFDGQSYLNRLTDPASGLFLANITFEPACRNHWHIHLATEGGGQVLLCTNGRGWYQEWGKEARALRPGDVVVIPPNVKHWHGAARDSWFTHIAAEVPGTDAATEWLEPVDGAQYDSLIWE